MINRYLNILIPGILLPMSLGSVYNYSQYAKNIMECFDISKFQADIGFTLIIFCLGMCAALFGRFVERNPKSAGIISMLLFLTGIVMMAISTYFQILPCYYIACSFMGAGTGIGYVAPVKQLLCNFENHRGLASGLAITGFGLGKVVCSPLIEFLLNTVSLPMMFIWLGVFFTIMLGISNILFKPNPAYIPNEYTTMPLSTIFKSNILTKQYISIWLMFCINISCGLAIISQEKGLFLNLGFKEIAILMSLTAILNILGRFGMSSLSDCIGRKAAYHYVCSFGILGSFLIFTSYPWLVLLGILIVEFAYGGNFSCLPSLIHKRFGYYCASTMHAITLSGWGIAGIIGPVLANTFIGNNLYIVLGALYLFGFTIMELFIKKDSDDNMVVQ